MDAAREAAEAGFDVLIACAFNYDAGASGFAKLGALSVLKARMNADRHMAEDLKNTGKGNLFVVFGEPDIAVEEADGGQLRVRVHGMDVYHPGSGDIRSDNADGIACWFVDTDYNGESFFVRHAYFLGANATDPDKSLKTTLKAEINADACGGLRVPFHVAHLPLFAGAKGIDNVDISGQNVRHDRRATSFSAAFQPLETGGGAP